MPLPEGCKGMADHGLAAKSVHRSAERLIEIQPRPEAVLTRFVTATRPKHHTLHNVRGPQVPDPAGEHDVIRSVHLAPVVPGSRVSRKHHAIAPATIFDFEKALGNVHVWGAVLAHRPEFHQVGGRADIPKREE